MPGGNPSASPSPGVMWRGASPPASPLLSIARAGVLVRVDLSSIGIGPRQLAGLLSLRPDVADAAIACLAARAGGSRHVLSCDFKPQERNSPPSDFPPKGTA